MATAAISDTPATRSAIADISLSGNSPQAPGPRLVRPDNLPAVREAGFFSDALLENHHLENSRKSKLLDLLVVILLHVALIGGPILAGLYFTDTLNLQAYYKTMIVGPPPPPPERPMLIAPSPRSTPR